MSDTKALIKYVSDRLNDGPNITFGKPTVCDLVDALEQAEARVKSRNNHIHRLLGEALENERNLDGMKSRWQTAEAEVARLTKERDWLAEKCAMHCHDKDGDEMCSYDTCGMFNCWHVSECEWKEAARRAVADSEVK